MLTSREKYTKIILNELTALASNQTETETNPKTWWQNSRSKDNSGLRLTDEGLKALTDAGFETYPIALPPNTALTPAILVFLDQIMTTPYHLTQKEMRVTCEKKAIELILFSGDLRKYGVVKALSRHNYVRAD